jgi:nucleotide-binding universal stress UspA family protein
MYRRILVPLDGTRFGEHAVPYAVALATRSGAAVELLHVHHHQELDSDLAAMPQYRFQQMEQADLAHDRNSQAAEATYLEHLAGEIEARYGIKVATRVVTGATAEAIAMEAGDMVADLVVLSSHARTGFGRAWHGHIAAELIQQLNVPALCVRPADAGAPLTAPPLRRVLIALDGSDFSEQVLDAAIPLVQALGAEPTLLHVVTPTPLTMSGTSDVQRVIPNRAEALSYLTTIVDRHGARMGTPALIALEEPDPAVAIAQVLAHGDYDMVAMATHGRSGLSRLLVGSVAEKVLALSARPVLLYRPRLVRLAGVDLTEAFKIYGD